MNLKFKCLLFFSFFVLTKAVSQTKISGYVVDKKNQPVPFVNIAFKNSTEGVLANEDGHFYLESPKMYQTLVASAEGYSDKEIALTKSVLYDFKIVLSERESLKEVVVFRGKTSKKDNPALVILRKIWARKHQNGLKMFRQYQYDKYEKVEFDMNSIDSAFMKNRLFKGMEFIFKKIDTSKVTGKTYLPIFINESLSEVFGDNKMGKEKEVLKANKNSGLRNDDGVNTFIKDLYSNYDIYDNYLKFFDKSFTSPISKTGIDVYNYVLRDSAIVDNKWCYNIVFYPRRKNELTFKGDFWVNDTTFAIKNINMAVTKSANINWVKDIYIEQEFDVVNDSVFLLSRDYMMSDFALNKKEKSKGVYGKRTTLYRNHLFDKEKNSKFYDEEINFIDNEVFKKPDEYWQSNRFEKLNKDELGIYKMLDTLKTVKKFKRMYNLAAILGTGYINIGKFDYGPIYSTFGYNEVEGVRLRVGGRTYFGMNDTWRLQGYTAYGFRDQKIKYGISGKWMMNPKNRLVLSGGYRQDVEQIGASLSSTNDVLGRSYASSGIFNTTANGKLTSIQLANVQFDVEPIKNLNISIGFSYRTLTSASNTFSLDYYTDIAQTSIRSTVKQADINFQLDFTPKKKSIGYGVERSTIDDRFSRFFINYSHGFKGVINSDFMYDKLQLFYKKPLALGAFGNSSVTIELGKTFGTIPLGLMSVVPGNQSYFLIGNTFNNLNFYELITDQYATLRWEHNFQGNIFARIPMMRKLNWREIIGVKAVVGSVSDNNKQINASGLEYISPTTPYWEYSAGIGNIFKVFRIDASWRGNYRNMTDANKFNIKASFGFYF